MKKVIINVIGRTASGKNEVVKGVCKKLGLDFVKSYATRKPRPEELNGESDHIFVTNEEFEKLENFVAKTEINGVKYGATEEQLRNAEFYVIDPNGRSFLKENFEDKFYLIDFYIYANEDIRKKRFIERGGSKSEFDARNNAESWQFDDYERSKLFDVIIFNNDDVDSAVNLMAEYVSLILEKRIKEKRECAAEDDLEESDAEKNEIPVEAAVEDAEHSLETDSFNLDDAFDLDNDPDDCSTGDSQGDHGKDDDVNKESLEEESLDDEWSLGDEEAEDGSDSLTGFDLGENLYNDNGDCEDGNIDGVEELEKRDSAVQSAESNSEFSVDDVKEDEDPDDFIILD